MKQIDKSQIVKIHVAKSQLKLSDENYKAILSGFNNQSGEPVNSSKELNYEQAEVLLSRLKEIGWKPKSKGKPVKYEEYANRDYKYASPKQLRMLEAMWMELAREKTEFAFNKFVLRITHKSHISFILKTDVQKLKKAIENL
jgi:hypothetical protein